MGKGGVKPPKENTCCDLQAAVWVDDAESDKQVGCGCRGKDESMEQDCVR